jgi:hypothetical protein
VYKHIACLTVSDISFERTRNSATSMGGKRRIVRQTLIFGRGHRTVPGLAAHPQMRLRPFLERPERLCDGPAKGSNRVLDAERCCLTTPQWNELFRWCQAAPVYSGSVRFSLIEQVPRLLGRVGDFLFRVGFLDRQGAEMMRGSLAGSKARIEGNPVVVASRISE